MARGRCEVSEMPCANLDATRCKRSCCLCQAETAAAIEDVDVEAALGRWRRADDGEAIGDEPDRKVGGEGDTLGSEAELLEECDQEYREADGQPSCARRGGSNTRSEGYACVVWGVHASTGLKHAVRTPLGDYAADERVA